MNDLPQESHIALDQPSSLDFVYEDVFGSETDDQKIVEFIPRNVQNQGAELITKMACSRYGMVHIINAQNEHVAIDTKSTSVELQAKEYWLEYLKINPDAEFAGATLQSALKQFNDAGLITGYSVCNSIDSMKSSIQRGRLIYTGSNNGDWQAVRDTHNYILRTDGRVVGHCFCIVGYYDKGWIAINSYGESNGIFYIPFDLTDTLFTRYSVVDSKDEEAILSYKKRIMDEITIEDARLAVEEGIWSGRDPQKQASREEVFAGIYRALQSLKK